MRQMRFEPRGASHRLSMNFLLIENARLVVVVVIVYHARISRSSTHRPGRPADCFSLISRQMCVISTNARSGNPRFPLE